jgi:hypothetical protein
MEQNLIEKITVSNICKKYKTVISLIDEIATKTKEASDLFKSITGYSFWEWKITESEVIENKKLKKNARKDIWRYIIKKTNMEKLLNENRLKKLEEQIEKDDLPDITPENIFGMIKQFAENAQKYFDESIMDVFKTLNPTSTWSQYATNDGTTIGKKAILDHYFGIDFYGNPQLKYHRKQRLQDIDNAFHMLDGKGTSKGGDNPTLVQAIEIAQIENFDYCETEYFKCKWYKKGTLHIEFKRMDLVEKINNIVSENFIEEKQNDNTD